MNGNTDQRLRVTLRQLEVFVATARGGSTRAAAEKVARSQSAASNALAELETTLGVGVFDRAGRRLALNENGRALLPHAVALLERAGELEALYSTEHAAPLRLASSFTIGEYLLPRLISDWKLLHPHGTVRLDIANTQDVLQAVAGFEVDVGFIEGARSQPELQVQRWLDDELIVIAAPGHPAAKGAATARKLAQASWILREQGSGTREVTDRWIMGYLSQAQIELELGSNEAVKRAVASGLGLGCISRLAVADALQAGWLVEVRTKLPPLRRTLAIVTHRKKRLGSVAQDFVDRCLAHRAAGQRKTAGRKQKAT